MVKERKDHTCAVREKITYVIGGQYGEDKENIMEMWNGDSWTHSKISSGNGYMDGSLLEQHGSLYFFQSPTDDSPVSEIWKIDGRNRFNKYRNMKYRPKGKGKYHDQVLTVPSSNRFYCY